MTASSGQSLPWGRIFVEAVAVVASILLAFSIDAWWDGQRERNRETDLLQGLLADFQTSRADLVGRAEGARRIAHANRSLRDAVSAAVGGGEIEVSDTLVTAVIGGPTYEPTANTLDAAIASGEIELILNDELREALAHWRRILADTREDELAVRSVSSEQVVPLLAQQIDLASRFDLISPWFFGQQRYDASGRVALRPSTQLGGALALRLFYAEFSAEDLAILLDALDRVVELIETELNP